VNSEKVQIRGAGFCYNVHVGRGLIGQAGSLTREKVQGHQAAIITDSNVPRTLVEKVASSLFEAEFQVTTVVVRPGENSKSLAEVERVCGEILELDRNSILVGIGGGIVGDLSGFVAAVFHRGIRHVQIPTTLLAMVDSAIGGKTGVNLPAGKNLVGAIHHPSLVIVDPNALATLPPREMRQGYAEIVKHAIIRDSEMFAMLSSRAKSRNPADATLKVATRDPSTVARDDSKDAAGELIGLIARNIRIKADIVSADDRDVSGKRALLNFGHTVGHGVERASDFQLPHGECVSLGIIAACEISVKRAGLPRSERDHVIALLEHLGLPTRLPGDIPREKIIEAITRDKKFEGSNVRFVVTPRIGEAFVSREVTMDDIREAIAAL
jgi:3-dehydroquinate synthase